MRQYGRKGQCGAGGRAIHGIHARIFRHQILQPTDRRDQHELDVPGRQFVQSAHRQLEHVRREQHDLDVKRRQFVKRFHGSVSWYIARGREDDSNPCRLHYYLLLVLIACSPTQLLSHNVLIRLSRLGGNDSAARRHAGSRHSQNGPTGSLRRQSCRACRSGKTTLGSTSPGAPRSQQVCQPSAPRARPSHASHLSTRRPRNLAEVGEVAWSRLA
jgi:hypothetical protein